jgi:hypothetical protein
MNVFHCGWTEESHGPLRQGRRPPAGFRVSALRMLFSRVAVSRPGRWEVAAVLQSNCVWSYRTSYFSCPGIPLRPLSSLPQQDRKAGRCIQNLISPSVSWISLLLPPPPVFCSVPCPFHSSFVFRTYTISDLDTCSL